jgi:hypothetical protein
VEKGIKTERADVLTSTRRPNARDALFAERPSNNRACCNVNTHVRAHIHDDKNKRLEAAHMDSCTVKRMRFPVLLLFS